MNPAPLRIGVFGGAFDPPHDAHVHLAQVAIEQLQLDALHVLPTGRAWHKTRELTAASHRLAMCELAFAALPKVQIDPRETLRAGPTYTIDTLLELQQQYPGAQLYLLMGEDQARALPTWHRIGEIARLAIICVAARAGGPMASAPDPDASAPAVPVLQLQMPPTPLSATDVRQRLAQRISVAALVSEPVARYIAHHHLYTIA